MQAFAMEMLAACLSGANLSINKNPELLVHA